MCVCLHRRDRRTYLHRDSITRSTTQLSVYVAFPLRRPPTPAAAVKSAHLSLRPFLIGFVTVHNRHDDLRRIASQTADTLACRAWILHLPHTHSSRFPAMSDATNSTLAILWIVLYCISWPIVKLVQGLALVLSPFWSLAQFVLLPVTYLLHGILSVLLFPFRIQLLEKIEV